MIISMTGGKLIVSGNPLNLIDMKSQVLEMMVQAVWFASTSNGNRATYTGTVSQIGNTTNFSYAPSPSDKLVVQFSSGLNFEITITRFEGYVTGTADDFLQQHHVTFTVFSKDNLDLQIDSSIAPSGKSDALYSIWQYFQQTNSGMVFNGGDIVTLNLQIAGGKKVERSQLVYHFL